MANKRVHLTRPVALSGLGDKIAALTNTQSAKNETHAEQVRVQGEHVRMQADHTHMLSENLAIQEHLQMQVNQLREMELECDPETWKSKAIKIVQSEHKLSSAQTLALYKEFHNDASVVAMFCDMLPDIRKLWIAKWLYELGFML
ncbi:hypothetical protein K439DRAFT_1620095 [Ramaria rubella]|nr:hypothetical protein K439DRAFT_1620095 [Ramaria rubella]